MAIYAIADLHLSLDPRVEKPMDVFGPEWANHAERLKEAWERAVQADDTVLIAGDISWALKQEEAMADLDWIHALPGRKVLMKGNHELWWLSIGKLRKLYKPEEMYFLQNDCYPVGDKAICGTRGWICPGTDGFDEHDEKIYQRELMRLEMSLSAAKDAGFDKILGALHYPPTNDKKQPSGFTDLFERYGVKQVVYGHLHTPAVWPKGLQGNLNGVNYKLISLDYLGCELWKLSE